MSTIEWTDETWNPTVGCSRVSPGCDNCYAINVAHRAMQPAHEGLTVRRPGERTDWNGTVRELPDRLDTPLRWRKPRRVFVDSMSDLFHPDVSDEFIARVFGAMACAPRHTFQILTKRPQRMATILADSHHRCMASASIGRLLGVDPAEHGPYDSAEAARNLGRAIGDARERAGLDRWFTSWPLPNVWLGTSIESDRYVWRADRLRDTTAAVRFLSLEPLLGPLPSLDLTGIDWVIVGGESGPGARPMHPAWVHDIRDRCTAAGIPFFFKQWGDWTQAPKGSATHLLKEHGVPMAGGGRHEPSLIPIASGTTDYPYGRSSGRDQDLVDRGHAGWVRVRRVGKKAAGRELDGRTWDEMPQVERLEAGGQLTIEDTQ